jgi:hypothetical protein
MEKGAPPGRDRSKKRLVGVEDEQATWAGFDNNPTLVDDNPLRLGRSASPQEQSQAQAKLEGKKQFHRNLLWPGAITL